MELKPDTAWGTKNLRLDSAKTQGKTKYYSLYLKKKSSNKMSPKDILL